MIPNLKYEVEHVANQYPLAWQYCHKEGHPARWDFNILLGRYLKTKHDGPNNYGMNAKRGNYTDPSMDVIFVKERNESGQLISESLFDVVFSAGSSNQAAVWNLIPDDPTVGKGYIDPFSINTYFKYDNSTPIPPSPLPPKYPYPDENTWWKDFEIQFKSLYAKYGQSYPNDGAFRWHSRTAYDIASGMEPEAAKKKHYDECEVVLKG